MVQENNQNLRSITACRVCGSEQLVPVFSLGELYISNFIDSPEFQKTRIPLELVLCESCSLLQSKHTVPPEQLYHNYWYFSGINKTMREELADIALRATKSVNLEPGDFVLDIGSNDSTLLLSYKNKDLRTVGFEPAKNLMFRAEVGQVKIINDFFNYDAWERIFGKAKAKIITAIAMFYDLDDPNKFVADVVKCLDEKGVFIIQMSYLPSMLQQNAFDNICHEHLEYYSLTSLENLLKRHELEIFNMILNDVNGGSFRVYIQHKGNRPISGKVARLRSSEKKLNLFDKKSYDDFVFRVNSLKEKLYNFIKNEFEKDKKIYVYGASTKGNTLLQFCNLDHRFIKAAADRNPIKWGKKTIATSIPIISEEQARRERPDYFLILPWHFLKEFIQREENYLRSGGKFIVPLPKFRIISYGFTVLMNGYAKKLNNLLAIIKEAYKKRGIYYIVYHGPNVLYRTYLKKSKKFFTFQNEQYNYFYHIYNCTCLNERAVEIPIVWKIVKDYQGKRILEIGNVLPHYFDCQHDIVDKYERFDDVINRDIVDFQPIKKYDLIVSISTLEHVGEDSELKDPEKILLALQNLKKCLAPGGKIIITLPLGYNLQIDDLLNEGKIEFTKQYFLKKISNNNEWQEINQNELQEIKYDMSRFSARGLVIGIIE